MRYTIDPGIYALGRPDEHAPVLVTANYKMSFDRLRESLPDLNAWILVLDTNGINVWCASGKGTLGMDELVNRIESTGLSRIVSHRRLILPQLAGPGVAAHHVKKRSGFRVIYGPVRAADLRAFLDRGCKATPEMRIKAFPMSERLVLIPVELVSAVKWAAIIIAVLFVLSGIVGRQGFWTNALSHGLLGALAIFASVIAGAVLTPLLLPWLPGRAFSLKGLWLGLGAAVILLLCRMDAMGIWNGRLETFGWVLMIPAATMYLAMNFTGASTYTSLSGVKREMRWALPVEIGVGAIGFAAWIASFFIS